MPLSQVEHLRQGVDQRLQGGQEKLQQLWLEWSKKQPGGGKDQVPPEVGAGQGVPRVTRGVPQPSPPVSPRRRWSRAR